MKDSIDPRDTLIEKIVTAFDSLMTQVHSGVQPRDNDPAVLDAKAALGWGKLYLTTRRDLKDAAASEELGDVLLSIARAGRKP